MSPSISIVCPKCNGEAIPIPYKFPYEMKKDLPDFATVDLLLTIVGGIPLWCGLIGYFAWPAKSTAIKMIIFGAIVIAIEAISWNVRMKSLNHPMSPDIRWKYENYKLLYYCEDDDIVFNYITQKYTESYNYKSLIE